jgi:hypothetical protein
METKHGPAPLKKVDTKKIVLLTDCEVFFKEKARSFDFMGQWYGLIIIIKALSIVIT